MQMAGVGFSVKETKNDPQLPKISSFFGHRTQTETEKGRAFVL